jgi:thiamine-phosphate pyrophosphorylase
MERALPPALLAITPGDLAPAGVSELLQRVSEAAAAGLRGILLREKQCSDRKLLDAALAVRSEHGELWLGLHDRPHLVSAAGAQAVHLGWQSLAPAEVRSWLPARFAIGLSTHQGDDLASLGPVDYVFFGPVLPTRSKPEAAPVGFELLRAAAAASPAPLWALGGLSPSDVRRALGAGAAGVACLGGILGQRDPGRAVEAYLREWPEAAHPC